jgi:hypothetical protein
MMMADFVTDCMCDILFGTSFGVSHVKDLSKNDLRIFRLQEYAFWRYHKPLYLAESFKYLEENSKESQTLEQYEVSGTKMNS